MSLVQPTSTPNLLLGSCRGSDSFTNRSQSTTTPLTLRCSVHRDRKDGAPLGRSDRETGAGCETGNLTTETKREPKVRRRRRVTDSLEGSRPGPGLVKGTTRRDTGDCHVASPRRRRRVRERLVRRGNQGRRSGNEDEGDGQYGRDGNSSRERFEERRDERSSLPSGVTRGVGHTGSRTVPYQ